MMRHFRPLSIAVAFAIAACGSGAQSASNCAVISPQSDSNTVTVGETWAGVSTGAGSATTRDGRLVVAYYDPDRYLTVATYDPRSGKRCSQRLESRFAGWDAHNALVVAIDHNDQIHVSGNMHDSALVYARGPINDLGKLRLLPMTGRNEKAVTYPRFMQDSRGNLLFLYRDGSSGNGIWRLNRWQDGQWQHLGALFANRDEKGPVSAYPSEFVQDSTGRFHVAVVWRRTSDVATNFAVTYASTADFRSWWVGSGGKSATGPLAPATMQRVDATGEGKGLVNNAKIAIAPSGQPLILYTKYGDGGRNATFAARYDGRGWVSKSIATASKRNEIKGGGSIPDMPTAAFVDEAIPGGAMRVWALPSRQDRKDLTLDPVSLKTAPWRAAAKDTVYTPARPPAIPIPTGLDDAARVSTVVRRNGVSGPAQGQLYWYGQKSNRDRARTCTPKAPRACNPPPSPLIWMPQTGR